MTVHSTRLWLTALFVAWAFDFLFWEKAPGISFAIFMALCLGGGFFLAWRERIWPALCSLWLLLPLGFFAVMTFVRAEPFTTFVNYLFTLVLMAMLAHTFRGGHWLAYSLSDYAQGLVRLSTNALIRPLLFLRGTQRNKETDGRVSPLRRLVPFLRGALLALPIVAVFAALLASADPVFARRLEDFLSFLQVNLLEYTFRAMYILVLAYLLAGIYLHALTASPDERLIGLEKPWLTPFLGVTEAAIILGSVDLLFAVFVGIQFRYFFGGQANITAEGFTYAEYARRGFGELVVVAFFSQMLFLGLSTVTRRNVSRERALFSALGAGLVVLVVVILVSAYQRLLLYEDAYGFTRLRIYTHVFMVWLALLLLGLLGLELTRRLRAFALAALLSAPGFGLSLNLLNVDSFIARQNVARALAGAELDTAYLARLSDDAIPTLIQLHAILPSTQKAEVGATLACWAASYEQQNNDERPWQSFHISYSRAQRLLEAHRDELAIYPVWQDERGRWMVQLEGKEHNCFPIWWGD